MEDSGEGRLLDGWQRELGEGFVAAVEDELKLCEFKCEGEISDFFEEEWVLALSLMDEGGEGLWRPDACGGGEVLLGDVDDAREGFATCDSDGWKGGEGGGGLVCVDEHAFEEASAFEEFELRGELLAGEDLRASAEELAESGFEGDEPWLQGIEVFVDGE